MKKTLVTCLFLASFVSLQVVGAEAFKSPDIYVVSKLESDWTKLLISRLRVLVSNFGILDPFKLKLDGPLTVREATLGQMLPAQSRTLLSGLGNALGLDFLNGRTNVSLNGFSYNVEGFKTDLRATELTSDGIILKTDISASDIHLEADRITLSLVIPAANNRPGPSINVHIIKPVISASEEGLLKFFAKLKIINQPESFKFQLQEASFDKMTNTLMGIPQSIVLNYEDIDLPQVSIRVGNRQIDFSKEKIKKYLRDNHEGIKGLLLTQVSSILRKNTADAANRLIEKANLKKDWWYEPKILNGLFRLEKITSAISSNDLEVIIPGDFCTLANFKTYKSDCLNHKASIPMASRLTEAQFRNSLEMIKSSINDGDANILASVSEDYINKLLLATYDQGLWNKVFSDAGISLGARKMGLRLDQEGDYGTLYLDVSYLPKRFERIVLGTSEIRFPLVLKVKIRIEKVGVDPVVIIRLDDIDLSDDTIINGHPRFGFPSSIKNINRFRGKVVTTIRSKIQGIKNKDLINLPLHSFRGLNLEKADFLSDGHGRMNVIMKLEDIAAD